MKRIRARSSRRPADRSSARRARRPFRPLLEQLESRAMLTGYFDQIADEISGPSGVLTQASRTLDAISSVAKLPLINKELEEVDEFNASLEKFRMQLDSKLRQVSPGTAGEIKSKIVEVLGPGPGGANVLANRVAPSTIGLEDVDVYLDANGPNSVDIVIDLGISADFDSSLGLGIDSVPLKPDSSTKGAFKAGVFYRNFRFGYDGTNAYVNTLADNELELELKGFLPSSFSAGLGFLNVSVADSTPGADPGDEDVTITLKADVTDTGIRAPALGIDLDFQAHVKVQTTFEGMPQLETDLVLQWELPAISPSAPIGGWTPPILEFNNVTLSVGSFIKDLAQPIAKYVKDVIEPLEPVFNLLEKRIPGLSDVAETFGQPSINLITLSNLLALSPNPPSQFIDAMRSAAKLRDLYTTISSLADRNAVGAIRLGNFRISGEGGSSLLDAESALSKLGLPALKDWSSLVTSGGPNLEEIKTQLRRDLGPVGGEIADVLTKLSSKAGGGSGDKAGFSFSFPIIENPSKVAMGMFLGRDEDIVSVGLDLNFGVKKDFFIKIVPGVSIQISPNISVNAATKIGYDTRGLRDAMKPLYEGSGFDADQLLNGLWISGSTKIDVLGGVAVGPTLGLPEFATVNVSAGVQLDVRARLYNPEPAKDKLRFFAGDFNDGTLFVVTGVGKANLTATVKVGGELPVVGFLGFQKTWEFLSGEFFRFSTDDVSYVPMPGSMVNRPVIEPVLFNVEDYWDGFRVLRLNAAGRATLRGVAEDEKNEDFTIEVVDFEFRLGQLPPFVPVIDVKAFGFVQRYIGRVDYILAEMGDGDDTVRVNDAHSKILYSIDGGTGNDKIDVNGSVPVQISGGDGDDTIDGGNGTRPTGSIFWDGASDGIMRIDGGNGRDTLSFGDGRLENLDPRALYYEVLNTSTDSIHDVLLIDNERSEIDTEYQIDTAGSRFADLAIAPKTGAGPEYAFLMHKTVALDLRSGSGNDEFLGFPTTYSTLNGGYGDDIFRPSSGFARLPTEPLGAFGPFPTFFVTIYGGEGTDSILVDESRNPFSRTYNIISEGSSGTAGRFIWSEAPIESGQFWYSGTENFELKSGLNRDSILMSGVLLQGTTIDSGAGDDRVVVGYNGYAIIRAPLSINTGSGNDSIELQNVSNGFVDYAIIEEELPDGSIEYRQVAIGNYTVPVTLEGGEGNNSLQIDDRNRRLRRPVDLNGSYYFIEHDRFHASTRDREDDYATIDYYDMELKTVYLSDDPEGYNDIRIASLGNPTDSSPEELVNVVFQGYESVDTFTLYPHDEQGNATLLRPIALEGGSNSDHLIIDDTNSTQPITYTFGGEIRSMPPFRQFIEGITPNQVTYSAGIQNVDLYAGNQGDTVNLDFTGFIRSLSLFGGSGNDLFNVSPNRKDLEYSAFILTSLSIDGGSGIDSLNVHNENNTNSWGYGIDSGTVIARRLETTTLRVFGHDAVENVAVKSGTANDVFQIESVASGQMLSLNGGRGIDRFDVTPSGGSASAIQGQLLIDGDADGALLRVFDTANTAGAIAHVEELFVEGPTEGTIGSAPGDALLGEGGSLRYRNLDNDLSENDVSILLGSGVDTVFAAPQTASSLFIDGGQTTTEDGDRLHLNLAQVQSPVVQDQGDGVGSVTSANRQPIRWAGIEQLFGAYTISGKVYKDVTGNGKSADDLPWSQSQAVTLNLYRDVNGDGAYQSSDTFLASTIAGPGGVYSFTTTTTGKYIIKEVVPSGFVRTFPAVNDYAAVNLTASASTGQDWYNAPKYNTGVVSNLSYIVNHGGVLTTVTNLRGNTYEGDRVTARFTVAANEQITLVSYVAPGPTFDANTASQQTVFQFATSTFGPGTHSLTIDIPKSFYQIDLIVGPHISQLGSAGSNIFYSAQNRLLSADNGGVNLLGAPAIDLALSTTVDNPAPLLGSNVVLTVKVSNAAGWSAATGVRVKDALPSGITFVSASATQGTYNSSTGEWNLVNPLASGATATLTITATVATAGEKKNAAQVTAAGAPDIDSTPNNDPSLSTPKNEDDDDTVSISPQLWTKYFVVNDASSGSTREKTFEYAADGTAVENYQLNSGNTAPRGAATVAAGNKVWVIDANKTVYVYNAAGTLLGSWSAGGLASNATLEGIATNGTDIWIVDAQQDKVFKYANAASRTSGSQNAASSFALNSGNSNPKDIVASSTNLWVVDDSSTDKVFKYTLAGSLVGSWTITAGGGSPTGITLDPASVNHLWIVDKSTDRVYQFNAAASRSSGSQSPASYFALSSGNTSPEGIADPPPSSTPVAAESREASRDKMSSYQALDFALLAVIDEINTFSGPRRKKR